MNRLIDDIKLEPWDKGPEKNALISVKIPHEKKTKWERPVSLQRPVRKLRNIVKVRKQCSIIEFNDVMLDPKIIFKNTGRKFRGVKSPSRTLNKNILRSSSCIESSTSIFDIENIERIQKLLPFTPMVSYKIKPIRNGIILPMPEELGIQKSFAFTQKNYRKFIKKNN